MLIFWIFLLGIVYQLWARIDPHNPVWPKWHKVGVASGLAVLPLIVLYSDSALFVKEWIMDVLAVSQDTFAPAAVAFSLGMMISPALNPPVKFREGEYEGEVRRFIEEKKLHVSGVALKAVMMAFLAAGVAFLGSSQAELVAAGLLGLALSLSKLVMTKLLISEELSDADYATRSGVYSSVFLYSSMAFIGILFCFWSLDADLEANQPSLIALVIGAVLAAVFD